VTDAAACRLTLRQNMLRRYITTGSEAGSRDIVKRLHPVIRRFVAVSLAMLLIVVAFACRGR